MNTEERAQATFNALTKTPIKKLYSCTGVSDPKLCIDLLGRDYGCLTCAAATLIARDVSGVAVVGPIFEITGEVRVVRTPSQIVDVRYSRLN